MEFVTTILFYQLTLLRCHIFGPWLHVKWSKMAPSRCLKSVATWQTQFIR